MKLLAVMEAASVTGPAKNLIDFAARARELPPALRVDTSVVTFEREGGGSGNPFLAALRAAGIPAISIRQRSVTDRHTLEGLRAAVETIAPDILQTHAVKSHFLVRLSGLGARLPWIAFHHGYTTPDLKMRLYNQLDRWSLRAPDRILTVSRAFESQLRDAGVPPGRITVLHNAIDADWIHGAPERSEARRRFAISDAEPVVLTVGRLSHEKAHVDLVAAAAACSQFRLRVLIAGDGPERAAVQRTAQRLGISDRVTLLGFLPDPRPCYAAADIVVLSSVSEGSPNALLEAMAAGVPVVATAVGGIPEIVSDPATALLVPPRDPQALARAIAATLADPAGAQGRVARARMVLETRHSSAARVRALADIYRELRSAHANRH